MPLAIRQDTATPRLHRLAMAIQTPENRRRFLMRWGARVRKLAIDNALAKGGRRFWREIARSINLEEISTEGGVLVGAAHVAAAQKQYGGIIKAKGKAAGGADALTIPISDESRGHRAAKFVLAGRRLFAIGMDRRSGDRGVLGYEEDDSFHPLYALRRQTRYQRPDPFFPSAGQVSDIGATEAQAVLSST